MSFREWLRDRGFYAIGEFARHAGGSFVIALGLALLASLLLRWEIARYVGAIASFLLGYGYEAAGNRSLKDLVYNAIGILVMLFLCGGFGFAVAPPPVT